MTEADVAIVGGGPAGLSAAIWAHTLKLSYALFDANAAVGGQLHRVYNQIVDYPGVEPGDGAALAARFADHLERLNVVARTGVPVTAVDCAAKTVVTSAGEVRARHLVLATGIRRRTLGVPGEAEFVGRGVSPSASKFAHLFRGKPVLVVGGGDAAFEEALILADVCERVTLVHHGDSFRARPDFRARVAASPTIEIRTNTRLLAIEGAERVERARVEGPGGVEALDVAGVFVCAGVVPSSELFAGQVDLDERGYVVTGPTLETSVDGVYAAGDVCSGSSLTIAAAVGQGAAAVKAIQRRLSRS